jgi:hypothetical protein
VVGLVKAYLVRSPEIRPGIAATSGSAALRDRKIPVGPKCSPAERAAKHAERRVAMPNGRKRKRKKIATHKRKKRLRKNRHKKK